MKVVVEVLGTSGPNFEGISHKRHSIFSMPRRNHGLKVVLRKIDENIDVKSVCEKNLKKFPARQPVISIPKLPSGQMDLRKPNKMSLSHSLKHEEADKNLLVQHCNTNLITKKYSKSYLSLSSKNINIDLKNICNDMVNMNQKEKKMKNSLTFVVNSPINDPENITMPSESQTEKTRMRKNSFVNQVRYNIPADFEDKQFEVKLPPLDNFVILALREPFHGRRIENQFIETVSETEETFKNRETKIRKNLKLQRLLKDEFYVKESSIETNSAELVVETFTETVNNTEITLNNSARYKRRKSSSPSLVLPLKRKRGRPRKSEIKATKIRVANTLTYSSRPIRQCRLRNMKPEEVAQRTGESVSDCPNLVSLQNGEPCSQKSKKLNVSLKTPCVDDKEIKSVFSNKVILARCDIPVSSTPCAVKSDQRGLDLSFLEKSYHKTPASYKCIDSETTFAELCEKYSNVPRFAAFSLPSTYVPSSIKGRKRMTRREAQKKTESYNNSKKIMEEEKKILRFSERLAVKKLTVCSPPSPKKKKMCTSRKPVTPYVLLNKLKYADISSYKITPLREERVPGKAKTLDDYGIEDVNTDDSTDDEEFPKKTIPDWAKEEARKKCAFEVSRKLVAQWMKPPKFRNSLMKTFFK